MPATPRPGGLEPAGGSGAPLLPPEETPPPSTTPPPPPPLAPWVGAVADVTLASRPWDGQARGSLSKKNGSPPPPPVDEAIALDVASAPSSDGGSSSDASSASGRAGGGGGGGASSTPTTAGLWRRASGAARRRASGRVAPAGLAARADSSTSSLASSSSSSAMPYVPASRAGSTGGHRTSSKASVFDVSGDGVGPWRASLAARVDGLPAVAFVAAVTLVSNFMDDVRLAVLPRGADRVCEGVAAAIFAVFVVDTLVGCVARAGYPLRLFFWIDLAATASMLLEVPSLMRLLTGHGAPGPAGASVLARGVPDTPDQRARQILRVLRILRLLRVVKLVQLYQAHRDAAALEKELAATPAASSPARGAARASTFFPTARPSWLRAWRSSCGGAGPRARPWWTAPPRRSRVAQRLSDLSASRVVVGVLALLLAIPGFNINSGIYGDYPPFAVGGLALLAGECALATANGATALPVPPPPAVASAATAYAASAAYKLVGRTTSTVLQLTACNATLVTDAAVMAARRPQELAVLSSRSAACAGGAGVCLVTTAVLDVRWNSQFAAMLNLLRTVFIILAMGVGIYLLQRDATRLVARPLERMLSKARALADNPLASRRAKFDRGGRDRDRLMETRILEVAFTKVCSLLAVGFGDAGAEVIAGNLRSGGDLAAVVPGRRVRAIFGFCDIRQFTDATEVLQEDVMEFVNTIAKIVHQEVYLHGGAPNKNIGDAFLLVWKFPDGAVDAAALAAALAAERAASADGAADALALDDPAAPGAELEVKLALQKARRLADQALASLVIVQAALRRSRRLAELVGRADVQARLPGFGVKMGFGLHVGWAIEGAIGSEYKIDASYLSPNVNMASRLEAATKQYGVPLLMSGEFAALLSPALRARARPIDVVTVKGSAVPVVLHTYDVDVSAAPGLDGGGGGGDGGAPPFDPPATFSDRPYSAEFDEHPDLAPTWAVDGSFLAAWRAAFTAYRMGEWGTARARLEACAAARPGGKDGPAAALLAFMGGHGFVAPKGWRGFRELTEK